MASQSITLDSGLISIALVVRSGTGPRFVFHYPPHPTEQVSQRERRFGTELDVSDEEDYDGGFGDSDGSDLEDDNFLSSAGKFNPADRMNRKKQRHMGPLEGDDHYDSPSGEQIVPWEHLGEFSTTDLEMILTPSKAFHKKKFELSLDPLHFVSYPMHIREDGFWRKRRQKKTKKSKKDTTEAGPSDGKPVESVKREDPEKDQQASSSDPDDNGGMTMFNVVFILSLPKDNVEERILIYDHVVKKFNKALKHAQAQDDYVWKESEKILVLKEKARDERKSPFIIGLAILIISRSPDELAMEPDSGRV